jgi:3-deoxy-D-manno-octulosonate 8-phosphate phosphatase (KDO 8-P phosphatase)
MSATSATIAERAARVRCLFLDIDGVLTDCRLWLAPDGTELKTVHVRDGLGIKLLLEAGIEVAIISGRPSDAMHHRFSKLGVRHIVLDTPDKLPAYERIRDALGLDDTACAAMGDDTPDLPLMQRTGLALTVADAHPRARAAAHWASQHAGGFGAVREAADLLLGAQGLAK